MTTFPEMLRARQQHCEELGRLPDETNHDFLNAGFYRILQPRRFGGYECSMTEYVRLVVEVSRGGIASGWVLSLMASAPAAILCLFPEQAPMEAYGANGDCRGGYAIPEDGGYRIKGAWDYCSGCDIATHIAAAVLLRASPAQPPTGAAFALLDRAHCAIEDNWNMIGMQGTGSRRVVLEERTVPAHRVLPITDDLWWPRDYPGSPRSTASAPPRHWWTLPKPRSSTYPAATPNCAARRKAPSVRPLHAGCIAPVCSRSSWPGKPST